MKIKEVRGREILDSRGLPTVECEITLERGLSVVASSPSGASTGVYEAVVLRDEDEKRYFGLGKLKSVENINKKIAPLLIGREPDFKSMDQEMISLDGTTNKEKLGANTILAVSIALVKAQALSQGVEVYEFIAKEAGVKSAMPVPMFNLINGALHASNGLCIQEFMVMPAKQKSFSESLEGAVKVYQHLKSLLFDTEHAVSVGDEGGFAPIFAGRNGIPDLEALDYLAKAIEAAGFNNGEMLICLDVAASHFFDNEEGAYFFHNHEVDSDELIEFYEQLLEKYPIYSIEDGIDQEDYEGWQQLMKRLGKKVQIVGDDLFATNTNLISGGIENKFANAAIIKPNQIGTVSETLEAVELCKKGGLATVVSHRSGETGDTFIADFAVGIASEQFKAGACARGERVAKYNRLLRIEEALR